MFFIILPISNTGDSAADILATGTIQFLYPKLGSFSTWSTTSSNFLTGTGDPKRFIGLIQTHCSPSFDSNWGKQNDPTAWWRHQLHPRYRILQQIEEDKCLSY